MIIDRVEDNFLNSPPCPRYEEQKSGSEMKVYNLLTFGHGGALDAPDLDAPDDADGVVVGAEEGGTVPP